jgi:hypothetical protein
MSLSPGSQCECLDPMLPIAFDKSEHPLPPQIDICSLSQVSLQTTRPQVQVTHIKVLGLKLPIMRTILLTALKI